MAGLTTEKATQVISGSQTLLLFACDMFWSKPASYSQLHSYKQRWWLLRGTQVLVSWLLLWCWVDDYWSFFDYCCGVHPSHGLLRLGLPLPFQPEVTCFVHPLLHKDGKELPASIENMLIPKMCDCKGALDPSWSSCDLSFCPLFRSTDAIKWLEFGKQLKPVVALAIFYCRSVHLYFCLFLFKTEGEPYCIRPSGCGTFLLNRRKFFVTLQDKTSNARHQSRSKRYPWSWLGVLSSCLFVCASGLRGSRILSYPRHEKDNHQPGLSATSHAERGNLSLRQLCHTLTL